MAQQMIADSKQMKVVMPQHLYAALWQEAKDAGVTMADLVRLAVKERYERKLDDIYQHMPENGK